MVARLVEPQFLVLYAFAASVAAIHFRGRVRPSIRRELTHAAIFAAPYNVLMYLFSAVPNKPVLPVATIPELGKLKDNWEIIREEALALFDEGRIKAADKHNDWGFASFFRSGWKRFYLKWYEDPLPSAQRMCPRTVALLESIPCIKGAMFATLSPGARLPQHRDPFAGSLRYHLGLVTPTHPGKCRIVIDGTSYSWRDGEDLLFDETFVHYADGKRGRRARRFPQQGVRLGAPVAPHGRAAEGPEPARLLRPRLLPGRPDPARHRRVGAGLVQPRRKALGCRPGGAPRGARAGTQVPQR